MHLKQGPKVNPRRQVTLYGMNMSDRTSDLALFHGDMIATY